MKYRSRNTVHSDQIRRDINVPLNQRKRVDSRFSASLGCRNGEFETDLKQPTTQIDFAEFFLVPIDSNEVE